MCTVIATQHTVQPFGSHMATACGLKIGWSRSECGPQSGKCGQLNFLRVTICLCVFVFVFVCWFVCLYCLCECLWTNPL